MKLKAATLRTFTTVHSWTGLVAGFALFVAFYAGAITVFHEALQRWQSPQATRAQVETIADAQRLLDITLDRHVDARQWIGMLFPGDGSPHAMVYWPDAANRWHYATLAKPEGSAQPDHTSLSELVNTLHFSLGIPVAGTYLMGVVSLLYGLAVISGVVIHLPMLAKDLFAMRPGRNLKRFWQDAHNVIGVVGLPMHLMFAVTGAMLCLLMVLAAALDPLIYDGKLMQAMPTALDTAPVRSPTGLPVSPASLERWLARSAEVARDKGLPAFDPVYLKLTQAGDSSSVVEVTGQSPGALGPLGAVALDAGSGAVLATQLPGTRDANHAVLASAYALHFGEYGNLWVKFIYLVLGIGGAFLFYSGNLLWVESRRRRRQPQQDRVHVYMARATVGVCIGLCVAVSASFVATQCLEWLAQRRTIDVASGIGWVCFGSWLLCGSWAALRSPVQAARELLWLAALVTALVPVAHGLVTGGWLWRSAASGQWALFWVDAVALAMAWVFAMLARATGRRAIAGEPNSVWSGQRDRQARIGASSPQA